MVDTNNEQQSRQSVANLLKILIENSLPRERSGKIGLHKHVLIGQILTSSTLLLAGPQLLHGADIYHWSPWQLGDGNEMGS